MSLAKIVVNRIFVPLKIAQFEGFTVTVAEKARGQNTSVGLIPVSGLHFSAINFSMEKLRRECACGK
jgi:hypothetical protein